MGGKQSGVKPPHSIGGHDGGWGGDMTEARRGFRGQCSYWKRTAIPRLHSGRESALRPRSGQALRLSSGQACATVGGGWARLLGLRVKSGGGTPGVAENWD